MTLIARSKRLGPWLAGLALAGAAGAQTLYVNASAAAGGDGASWASAFRDLQSALIVARPGDQVWVAKGRYVPSSANPTVSFVLPESVPVYGGFAGNETSLAQRDPALNVSLLDGDLLGDDLPGFVHYADNSEHVVSAIGTVNATLDGFTVRGGASGPGGGVRLEVENATLANLILRENQARGGTNEGGGIGLLCQHVQVRDCAFADNRATSAGGLLLRDPLDATVERCTFERNHATDGGGISVAGLDPGIVSVFDCVFRDALVTSGGGICAGAERFQSLQVEGCTFERLGATNGGGIAVQGEAPGVVTVTSSTFLDNVASNGSGLSVDGQEVAPVFVTDCQFEDGVACAGAGIFVDDGDLEVVRCTFRRNHLMQGCGTGTGGGAIRANRGRDHVALLDSSLASSDMSLLWAERGADLDLQRCTLFNGDTSSPAIRLVGPSSLSCANSIVWGLAAQQIQADALATVSATYSDVRTGGAALPGTGNLAQEPLFVDATLLDLHLSASSPCVEAGTPELLPLGADLDRNSRVLDGDLDGALRIDMGANEFAPIHLEVLGTPVVGGTLTFVSTGATAGTSGLATFLWLGRPGFRFVPRAGSLFLSTSGLIRSPWSSAPSSVPVLVPPGVIGSYRAQEIALGGGALTLSNFVPLDF